MMPSNFSFKRLLQVFGGIFGVVLLVWLWQHFINERMLTVVPRSGYTVTVGVPQNNENGGGISHVLLKTQTQASIRLHRGMYTILYQAGKDYAPGYVALNLQHSLRVESPMLNYSSAKLSSLLEQQSTKIHTAFQAMGNDLLAQGFKIQQEELYRDGSWYSARLLPADTTTQDMLVFIMHEVHGSWQVAAKPAITLYIGNYPNIPEDIIKTVDNLPSAGGLLAIPNEVYIMAQKYIQAREDGIGDDQSSPTSWLGAIRSLVTPGWLNHLQALYTGATSGVDNDYNVAHSNKFTVQATLTNCNWNGSSTNGTLVCSLTDTTLSAHTGAQVAASSLPFGWTHTDQQPAINLSFINQGNTWLISGDTGE